MVQYAHEAGAFDSLLSSVYKGEVQFSKDEMKVEPSDEAAIEQVSA